MATLYQKYGFAVDQILSSDQALPNATSGDSTNTIKLDNTKGDDVHVVVCAGSVTVELAGGNSLEIRPTVGTTSTCATVLPSILLKEAVTTDVSWASGEMICQFVIPAALIGANRYLKLTYVTTADERADSVDAFTILR
jgi:hypothetical protein